MLLSTGELSLSREQANSHLHIIWKCNERIHRLEVKRFSLEMREAAFHTKIGLVESKLQL